MTIEAVLNKIKALDTEKVSVEAVSETKEALLEKNKEQLLEGKLSTGQDIFPSYLDDPYFKSREAAQRYSNWKDKITPNAKRKPGTPNLFINGTFHNSIKIDVSGLSINFEAGFKGSEIESKFTDKIYGLGGEKKEEYLEEDLRPVFNEKIEAITGLKFKP